MSGEDRVVLHRLQSELEAELLMVRSDPRAEALALSPAEWLLDPCEVERFRVGLYGLLGAVKALEEVADQEYTIVDVAQGWEPTL